MRSWRREDVMFYLVNVEELTIGSKLCARRLKMTWIVGGYTGATKGRLFPLHEVLDKWETLEMRV